MVKKNRPKQETPMGKKYYEKGMKKYMKEGRKGSGFVTGHNPGIGRNDHAGLPSEKVMSNYPPNRSMKGGYLDDTISDIDAVQYQGDKVTYSNMSHQK